MFYAMILLTKYSFNRKLSGLRYLSLRLVSKDENKLQLLFFFLPPNRYLNISVKTAGYLKLLLTAALVDIVTNNTVDKLSIIIIKHVIE